MKLSNIIFLSSIILSNYTINSKAVDSSALKSNWKGFSLVIDEEDLIKALIAIDFKEKIEKLAKKIEDMELDLEKKGRSRQQEVKNLKDSKSPNYEVKYKQMLTELASATDSLERAKRDLENISKDSMEKISLIFRKGLAKVSKKYGNLPILKSHSFAFGGDESEKVSGILNVTQEVIESIDETQKTIEINIPASLN
jgi:Skp family chaperone for outer membrane proteins